MAKAKSAAAMWNQTYEILTVLYSLAPLTPEIMCFCLFFFLHLLLEKPKPETLAQWLSHYGLAQYEASLKEAGLDEYGLIRSIDEEDIDQCAQATNMTATHANALRKGILAVQNGSYPPNHEQSKLESEPNELTKLRESRADWKGFMHPTLSSKEILENACVEQARTVLFIGQTGAGKTTLINSLCNHLHCVGYDERFRYKLIMEEKDTSIDSKDTTKSQTREITKYRLRDLPAIDFALDIIDTPGFGDTEGPAQDQIIRRQFKLLFQQIDTVDAIYFVIKASSTRLCAIQKYIFNMVLDLFGKDVKNNIFILFTFSDGAKPPALDAVNKLKVPYAAYYQINNSGCGLPVAGKLNTTHRTFFDLGTQQFDVIFEALNKVKPVSTKLTRDTLKERENITTCLDYIGRERETAMECINAMDKTYRIWKAQQDKMRANEEYKVPDQETRIRREPLRSNEYSLCCNVCNNTCQSRCTVSDSRMYECDVIRDGYCTQCTNKCKWNEHSKRPYIIRRATLTVWKSNANIQEKYESAKQKAAECEDLMRRLIASIDRTKQHSRAHIAGIQDAGARLRQCALMQHVWIDDKYFDTLIQSEQDEAKPGWQQRAQQWQEMKVKNELLRNIVNDQKQECLSWIHNDRVLKYRQEFK